MEKAQLSLEDIKQFSPLSELSTASLKKLMERAKVYDIPVGKALFKKGQIDRSVVFLLSGSVSVEADPKKRKVINATDKEACLPLAATNPREANTYAASALRVLSVDGELLDVLLNWEQTRNLEVRDLSRDSKSSDDWMTRVLQHKAMYRIPPVNLQSMFASLEAVRVKKDDVIIKEGDPGDYFYILQEGRCRVTKQLPGKEEGVTLAVLGVGDSFGEEALISDLARSATITMITDGVVMRLGKEKFKKLLDVPLIKRVNAQEAKQMADNGAVWIDVRMPGEYNKNHIPNSLNIPLLLLRQRSMELDQDKRFIIVCDTGRRSSTGAYLLSERDFDVYALEDGMQSLENLGVL